MTYLFDIGNVLLSFDFEPALQRIAGPNAAPDAYEQIIATKDHFEAGKTPLQDYLDFVYPLLDFCGSDTEFFAAWNSIFTPVRGTWDLAARLKRHGHRLILFSNINPIHAPFITSKYPVFELFDHAVFSHEIGAIKPQPEFFTRAFEQFDIDPEDTIYIDDLAANIAMGKELGLQAFQYDHSDHQALETWLKPQGIPA